MPAPRYAAGMGRMPAPHGLVAGIAEVALAATLAASCAVPGEPRPTPAPTPAGDGRPTASPRQGGGPAPTFLVYFRRGQQLVAVGRAGAGLAEALRALVEGPTSTELAAGIRSDVPVGTRVLHARVDRGVAVVDLTTGFAAAAPGVTDGRVAQVVFTATGLPGVDGVRLRVAGVERSAVAGLPAAGMLTRSGLERSSRPPPPDGGSSGSPAQPATLALQRRLAALGYLPPAGVDGRPGPWTAQAVMAFQGWERIARDGVAGPATTARLPTAVRPSAPTCAGRCLVLHLGRQVLLLVEGSRVVRAIHVSTGKPGTPTPTGRFRVLWKDPMSWSVPFRVWMPYASYFTEGIAIHQYPDVPPYPASHGCVRVPAQEAPGVYAFAPVGTPVIVLAD